jgi:shikimate dehydrogenase
LIDDLRRGDLHGLNVTIPHKRRILEMLDGCSEAAAAIGAVNTLVLRDGAVWGENTDAPAFIQDMNTRLAPRVDRALILGAGGAARAAVYALIHAGWRVYVAARRIEQSQDLVSMSGGQVLRLTSDALGGIMQDCTLIVQTTPVGMMPDGNSMVWPADLPFPSHAALYDMVYNPADTAIVQYARRSGSRAVSGLGMLVEQAALAFEHWTGVRPARDLMMRAAQRQILSTGGK